MLRGVGYSAVNSIGVITLRSFIQHFGTIRQPLWSSGRSSWLQNGDVLFPVEVRTGFIYVMHKKVDHLCGLVVKVPGYSGLQPRARENILHQPKRNAGTA
jgi:hypothetical protein